MGKKIKDAIEFVTHGIWLKSEEDYESPKARWAVRQVKILILTAKGFGKHDIGVRSAALTFYTIMAIVPVLALVFGVIKGFGLEESLNQYLRELSGENNRELIDFIIGFANKMLNVRVSGGLVAGVGFVILLYAVINVFSSIEAAFNHIWEVRKQRSITRKISDYTAVVIVAPILWIVSNGLWSYIQRTLSDYTHETVMQLLFGAGSLVVLWLMFALIYMVLPNTKVKFSGAMVAGIITGTIFILFQKLYLVLQSNLAMYNAVYGSFAALPLFLIWLQVSWQILLLGAELSFAYQHLNRYEQELAAQNISYDARRQMAVGVMVAVVENFLGGGAPMGSDEIADRLELPVRAVRDITFDLEKAGLVTAASDDDNKRSIYLPSNDVHAITVMDVIYGIEESGNSFDEYDDTPEMEAIGEVFDRIKKAAMQSQGNVRLVSLVEELLPPGTRVRSGAVK